MAQKRGNDTKTPWWRTVPAMLTAAATFIGSVAAVLALFIGPGGGGGGSNGDPAREAPAPTEEPSVPFKSQPATEASLRKLLTMVPASVRSRCEQDPDEFADDQAELARLNCDLGGATFYYELYAHELDARDSFSGSVSNEEDFANGHARSCGEVRTSRPFVGTWTRPGQSQPAGRQLCTYDLEIMSIYWTEAGRPIVGSMLYSGNDRESSLEGAQLVWDRVMG